MTGERRRPGPQAVAYDVVVVGAGPAGLFAALGTAAAGKRVLVLEAGADVEARRSALAPGRGEPSDLVQGVGGAGLFSDGKLCLSLGVGGELPDGVTAAWRRRLLRLVAAVLDAEDALSARHAPDTTRRATAALAAGLEFSHYPVLHIGTEHCAERIVRVRDRVLAQGGHIATRSRLVGLDRTTDGRFTARVATASGEHEVTSHAAVLAMGKVGAHFETDLCRRMGAASSPLPMYIGVRLEADRSAVSQLFRGVTDPKYKLYFGDGTKMKTHCAADGGEVLALRYDGLPLAGGHAFGDRSSGRSSFGVLWDGIRGRSDTYDYARTLMRRASEQADGGLVAQRLCDYRGGRASTRGDIERCRPSTTDWAPGDLRRLLPSGYFDRFDRFIRALSAVVPGIAGDSTVLFAPAVEWWMNRIATDAVLQAGVPGLYVAGDGAGWSQGIVHAAATGLLAAEGISGRRLGAAALLARGRRPRPARRQAASVA